MCFNNPVFVSSFGEGGSNTEMAYFMDITDDDFR